MGEENNRVKAEVDSGLVKQSSEVQGLKLEFDNMKKLESPESWAEMAVKHVDAKLDSVALNVENVNKALHEAREAALEEQDKEPRRNNIIIYRAQESTATSAEDRLREDVTFCQNLLIGLNAGAHTVRTTDENYLRCLQLQPALSKVPV